MMTRLRLRCMLQLARKPWAMVEEGEEAMAMAAARVAVARDPDCRVVPKDAGVVAGREEGAKMDTAKAGVVTLVEVAMAAVAAACRLDKHEALLQPRT